MTTYSIRLADPSDLADVMRLIDQRIVWLHKLGTDQWSTQEFRSRMIDSIDDGFTWLLYDNSGAALATITCSTEGDPDFWTADELQIPALYVGKLATETTDRARGLGQLLIQWASDHAHRRGLTYVRWDVWRTNLPLQDYYRRLPDVRYVRTVVVPGRYSGALFEMAAEPRPELHGVLREVDDLLR